MFSKLAANIPVKGKQTYQKIAFEGSMADSLNTRAGNFKPRPNENMKMAETIWTKLRLTDRQLLEKREFVSISKIGCPEVYEPAVRDSKLLFFTPNWKLRLTQAAKLFANAWLSCLEKHEDDNQKVLEHAGVTQKQVYLLIRANKELLSRPPRAPMREAGESFANVIELCIMAMKLYRGKNSKELEVSEILQKITEVGVSNINMTLDSSWELVGDDEATDKEVKRFVAKERMLASAMVVTPAILQMEQWAFAAPKNITPENVGNFKSAIKELALEYNESILRHTLENAEVRDVAMMAYGMMSTQCFAYIIYQLSVRMMFQVQLHEKALGTSRADDPAMYRNPTLIEKVFHEMIPSTLAKRVTISCAVGEHDLEMVGKLFRKQKSVLIENKFQKLNLGDEAEIPETVMASTPEVKNLDYLRKVALDEMEKCDESAE